MRTVADPPDRRAFARQQVAHGLDAQRRGDFAAAQAAYHAVLQAIPDYFDALHLMGTLHLTAKAYPDAIRWLERAVAVNATV